MHIPRNHHYVICRLVEDNQRVVAVVDKSARGVDGLFQESVVVGVVLVFGIGNLESVEPEQVDKGYDDDKTADNIFPFFQSIVFTHISGLRPRYQRDLAVRESKARRIMKVRRVEARMRISIRVQL